MLQLQVESLRRAKLLQLKAKKSITAKENSWLQYSSWVIYLKKKKWNYGLFLCNRLKELQIWMIVFIFLFELAFCEIICSLVVWSSFVFVWIIFVVNLVFYLFIFFWVVYGVRDYVWETIIIFEIMLHLQHFKTNLI